MAENKAEKRKTAIVKRILKWIGLGLLSVLIILGLIFQAPWKVIALLLIILAACTQLPRPARKWFWFSTAAIVIVLIIWVFLPDWGEWTPYKYNFDKELADLNDKYAIPDEENAATIYNQLLVNYDANTFEHNLPKSEQHLFPMKEPWLSKDHPEIAEWLKGQQSTISTLMQASKIEKCQFTISNHTINTNMEQQTNKYSAMRRWVFLLVTAANNDIAEGRTQESLEKNITVIRISSHLYQQSTLIDLLVGIAVEAISYSPLKRFIVTGDATEEHLSFIEKALAGNKHNWSSDWPRILDYEKFIAKEEFARYYEVNRKGKIRLSRDPWAEMRARWKEQLEDNQVQDKQIREVLEPHAYLTYWQQKLIRAKTILYWFYIPSTPQKAAKAIDTCFEKYYAMADPNFDWKKEPKEVPIPISPLVPMWASFRQFRNIELLAGMSKAVYHRIHEQYLRTIAGQRGCQLIIALRRYKNKNDHWPETLDDIKTLASTEIFVDPINDNSFVYKLTEENFTLYSKGKNNIDEDGIRSVTFDPNDFKWPKIEEDDILIWPPRNRKTQEENTDVEQQ